MCLQHEIKTTNVKNYIEHKRKRYNIKINLEYKIIKIWFSLSTMGFFIGLM